MTSLEPAIDNRVQAQLPDKVLRVRPEAERAGAGASVQPGDAAETSAGRLLDTLWLLSRRHEHPAAVGRLEGSLDSSQDCSHFRKVDFRANRLKNCGPLFAEVLEANRAIEIVQLGDNSRLEVKRPQC